MRIGRGRRDSRHVSLYQETLKLLLRSQIDSHYGNPYISVIPEAVTAPQSLLHRASLLHQSHRKSDKWYNYRKYKDTRARVSIIGGLTCTLRKVEIGSSWLHSCGQGQHQHPGPSHHMRVRYPARLPPPSRCNRQQIARAGRHGAPSKDQYG